MSISSDHQLENLTLKSPLLTAYEVLHYLIMLEVVQNLTKKYRIHYSTGVVFDRYPLDRRDGFQKKAHKLNINIHSNYSYR